MEVWLSELGRLRDPDAHRRELLPHQRHLALGIAGDIRSRLIRYRSKMETGRDYFPRIESIQDSLGNQYVPGKLNLIQTGTLLRPGDEISFVVTAYDPLEDDLEYQLSTSAPGGRHQCTQRQSDNYFHVRITEDHIGSNL